ncbi:RNA-directed DNA polymerase, eukaryota, reverse transcriptase zinc-binding domain protein [Tanacetum coccineum]
MENSVGDCFMVNIYVPQDSADKLTLWNRLTYFMHHSGSFILFDSTSLVDLPIGARLYTWMNKADTKLSKLDRFLIFEDDLEALPDIRITTLDWLWSDHNPILLHFIKLDFGLIPFKLYNLWLSRDNFDDLIKSEWTKLEGNINGKSLKCHEKFRSLKTEIKQWNVNVKATDQTRKQEALSGIITIENKIEDGTATPLDRDMRIKLLQEVDKIDNFDSLDLIQKVRVNSPGRDALEMHVSLDRDQDSGDLNGLKFCYSNSTGDERKKFVDNIPTQLLVVSDKQMNEGFMDLKRHHFGGLWIWIQFPTPLSCSKFQENSSLKSICSSIKSALPSFKVDERMIWVEISGLPLCAWGFNAFKKVVCMFGKFIFFEAEESIAMSSGRVCSWSINIIDDSLDTSSSFDVNDIDKVADSVEENSLDDLNLMKHHRLKSE